jgi:alpha-amylase/alpha-mannosidase (GH57 family)
VVLHGHFYQPPRENPWTGAIDQEKTAAPDHDWNARINRECYAPLGSIPIGAIDSDPPRINAYSFVSFDVGPTLLSWLEREARPTLEAMVQGDRASRKRLGHGNAIAMPYHHLILPLCSRRDKTTEVRWGIADFKRVFGRDPAGMWLPETAVDRETLDVLAEEGIAFTVLAPHQVAAPPSSGVAGRVRTSGGRSIAVFAYDGALSHDVAFGQLLKDAVLWEKQLIAEAKGRQVLSLAMDGETFGHHHVYADLALGALLRRLATLRAVRLENFASALAAHPEGPDLDLVAPSSWSCIHGVERWRADCGCKMAPEQSSQQRWRTPLRAAVDWLAGEVHGRFERAANGGDPWRRRDELGPGAVPAFPADDAGRLAEMERSVLRAMTSCGWFFDDFAGLEGRQSLRYAAHAIALAGDDAPRLEAGFLDCLADAMSNDAAAGSARDFYLNQIAPERPA